VVTKVEEVKNLVELGIKVPNEAFPKIKQLAQSDDWKVREVAATCLVEISKRRRQEVLAEMTGWVEQKDANIRRASVEGLRGIARKYPEAVFPILEKAKTEDNLYVKQAVAHILREASKRNSQFVLDLCQKWAVLNNPNTNWIIKDVIKKLSAEQQKEILSLLKRL